MLTSRLVCDYNTADMKNDIEKRGRGRPKGATSFAKIKLNDLTNYLGRDASVVVSKKWLSEVGISIEDNPKKVLTPVDESDKIHFNVYE